MSLIDTARDALKNIPISDVLKERLSLALDQYAEADRKIKTLQGEKADLERKIGSLEAKLERESLDHRETQSELQGIKERTAEDVRVWKTLEFRRGSRTGGLWEPFCPKCHLPIMLSRNGGENPFCNDAQCGWRSRVMTQEIWTYQRDL